MRYFLAFIFFTATISSILQAQTGNTLSAVQYLDASTVVAVGSNGAALRSADGGASWTTQASGTTNNLLSVYFTNPSSGTAVGGNPLFGGGTVIRTQNYGSSWSPQTSGTGNLLLGVWFTDANTGVAVGNNGTIIRTSDAGASWSTIPSGTSDHLYEVCFSDASNGWVVGWLGRILRTTNGGLSWSSQTSGTTYVLYGVSFVNATTGTIVGDGGTVLHTTNGGSSWTSQPSGTTYSLRAVDFVDANTGYAVGLYGTIVKTTNGGSSWITQTSGTLYDFYAVAFNDVNNGVAVGYGGIIYRTSNGGSTWSPSAAVAQASVPSVPTLVSPANGAINQATSLTLSWNASSDASTYHLQVSTNSSFSSTILDDSTLTSTSRAVSSLANNTMYYWRVSAKNSSGSSAYSAAWSFTTIVAPPPAPVLASPANGAVSQPTSLTLFWNSSVTATSYRVQVSTTSSFVTLVVDDSTLVTTSKSINGLANNTAYYWRVSAKNVAGTSAYSSVWGFTTIVAPPPSPILSSPANGATNQPTTLTLTWNSSTGATSYRLQVSASSAFTSNIVDDSTLTTTTRQVTGLTNGTTYYWRVNAKNVGGTSAFSTAWSFGIIPLAPSAPTLVSPANGATSQATTLTLSWNASSGATSYRVQVSTSSTFSTTVVDDSTVTATSRQVSGLANNTLYYWRVNAKNIGGTSAYSSVWNFTTTGTAPAAPVLLSPANGATNQPTSLTLSWNASSGATSYRVQLSTSSTFTTTVLNDSNVTTTSRVVSSLANNTIYYWRVNAKNSNGTSAYSTVWSFTTSATPPSAPTLLSPANGATNQPTSLTLSWNASSGATSYRVQVSTSSTFSTTVVDDSTVTTTSRAVSSLANNTIYYWRVNAKNSNGTSAYSTVWSLTTTTTAAPAAPTLSSPGNGAANQPTTLTFLWNASSGATSYRLQISASSTFSPALVDDSTLATTSKQVNVLASSTLYYWRVNAKNSGGTSAYSTVWSLTTTSSGTPPPAPTLLSPANGATNQPTSLTLSWNTASSATSYRVQLSTSSTFATIVLDDSTVTTTSRAVSSLANNTIYYWRVNAKNSSGTSAYSSTWSLTTATAVTPPPAPTLLSPTSGVTNQPTTLTLSWSTSSGATSYRLQVSTNSAFSSTIVNDSTLTTTSRQVSGLANSTLYYWRVNAKNSNGTSAYSTVWSFTTSAPLPPVFSVDPTSLNFGTVAVGLPSTKSVTVTNTGGSTLVISSVTVTSSRYSVSPSSGSLAPGASMAFNITFTPTNKSTISAEVDFAHNAAGSPGVVTVTGRGGSGKFVRTVSDATQGVPTEFGISQNYPNPFNPTTTIEYQLPEPSNVRLEVFNSLGQQVALLIDNQIQSGYQALEWNATNTNGNELSSGIYYCRIQAISVVSGKEFTQLRKMMFVK